MTADRGVTFIHFPPDSAAAIDELPRPDVGLQDLTPARCLLIGLGILFAVVPTTFGTSLAGSSEHQIEILNEPQPSSSPRIDLGRRFGEIPCPVGESRKTLGEALRSEAKKILIHQFDERTWGDLDTVRDYLGRLLNAEPEGGILSPAVYWAEARAAEIFASVEFANGHRRPLQLANGYAHVQDASGCEWWGRYLGPDRSKWVVRP